MFDVIRRFFISADFYKSLTFIVAALTPVLVSHYVFSEVEVGFAIVLGIFYNASSNSPGSIKHRTVGMCVSILITTLATIIIGYSALNIWVLLPVLGIVTFAISYLSVYGFRATLVSLSGLMAVVISFANSYVNLSVIDYAFLVFVGGVWYLIVSSIANYFNPKMYIEELLSDTMKLTGAYLETRAKLLLDTENRKKLNTHLFKLQAELSEKHELLRDVILTRRQKSGLSNRIRRKLLLFIELVDMLELAIANPINYERVDALFKDRPQNISPFVELIKEMSTHLNYISKVILRDEKVTESSEISKLLEKVNISIDDYKNEIGLTKGREGFYMLVNLFEYQTAQVQKLTSIERVLNVLTSNNSLSNESKGDTRFITPQDYGWNKLAVNFSFKSSIFRHALRLSIVMVVGFLIGHVFSVQNSYWILLTIVVIMRPSYGLTKERMKYRIIGTFVGAGLALIMVYLIQDIAVFGVLAGLTLVLALSLVQLNYGVFAIFITLHIVFMYAMYSPDILSVIQFRIIDTLVGGGLAILANLFLFPTWEFMTIQNSVEETLSANSAYLKKIEEIYKTKKIKITDYKLSRKQSFLAMGDLNAAFQRMIQEPKSRQKYFSDIYDIVVLTNTFLSSLTSLGAFIRNHKTFVVSDSVPIIIENIVDNLRNAQELIHGQELTHLHSVSEVEEAKMSLENKYNKLSKKHDKILQGETEKESEISEVSLEIQETKLVLEQLSYLFSLSKSIVQKVSVYQNIIKKH
tara:strand:+ start:12807 stop:15056 length:2250 start_codon:yes stop_codon:yes gene_type:complete